MNAMERGRDVTDEEFMDVLFEKYGYAKICDCLCAEAGEVLYKVAPQEFDRLKVAYEDSLPGHWICGKCYKAHDSRYEAEKCCTCG